MNSISDHSLPPIEPINDPELVKWARYGVDQIKAGNEARRAYEQAERDYLKHNRAYEQAERDYLKHNRDDAP